MRAELISKKTFRVLNRCRFVRFREIEIHCNNLGCVLTGPYDHVCAEATNPEMKPEKYQKDQRSEMIEWSPRDSPFLQIDARRHEFRTDPAQPC